MTELTMSQARAILPQLLDRVARGEQITLTRYGRPAAVLLRPDLVRSGRAAAAWAEAEAIGEALSAARREPLGPARVSAEQAERWVEAIRSDRDR